MPKIKNFAKIANFSVFKNFDWNTHLTYKDKSNNDQIYDFKDINIIYGRNYSGKTSLSKIIRSLEKKVVPPRYENPDFQIELEDGSTITQSTLSSFNHPIHIYNSDFIKENLKFIHNEDDHIESFSVTLGDDNQQILERIQALKSELGTNEVSTESGLYLEIKNKKTAVEAAKNALLAKENLLKNLLANKATAANDSIKNKHQTFGDFRYDITKLRTHDIPAVQKTDYSPLTDSQRQEKEALILQRDLPEPPMITAYTLNFFDLLQSTESTLSTVVGQSSKIAELVENSALNSWVQTGFHLHNGRSTCAFCDSPFSEQRQETLRQHFDKETQNLQIRIGKGMQFLEDQLKTSSLNINFDINHYYSKFHNELTQLRSELQAALDKQKDSIKQLIQFLEQKKSRLFTVLDAKYPKDYAVEIDACLTKINAIGKECINLSAQLSTQQATAKKELRLDHIYHFLQNINYNNLNAEINALSSKISPLEDTFNDAILKKDKNLADIKTEEDKLKSEGEACSRINAILNHEFGHQALSLEPIEVDTATGKAFKFEIQRNGTKAHNLSEGECSLISFCYFLAKIQDDLDQNKKPIIWIDDPICSLDSNHIFFIYSLIETKICKDKKYKQLFISTHNLEFLKYLRRITGSEPDRSIGSTSEAKRKASYYLIHHSGTFSTIKEMPLYLSKYLTEFNYLFDQIYKCATIDQIQDNNYHLFYNFGNNARKFLEIYTFYKLPCATYTDNLEKFWGQEFITTLTDRIHNEYSHMCGTLERGGTIVDQPEMQRAAMAIIEKIQLDIDQYNALLESVGIEKSQDTLHPDYQPPQ